MTKGTHILLELFECDAKRLNDSEVVAKAIRDGAHAIGATVVSEYSSEFAPTGITAVAVLKESHISAHTWPEQKYAAIDIFSCGGINPEDAIMILSDSLSAGGRCVASIERGNIPSRVGAGRMTTIRRYSLTDIGTTEWP